MIKKRTVVIFLAMCLVLGTVPFALGATTTTTTNIYISVLYVGAPSQTPNQEYVQIKNKGTTSVNLNGWKIKDKDAKHTYKFSSYNLKTKSTVTLRSGKGKNSGSTLYWGKDIFIWNNHDPKHNENGDTAYLYNAQGKLVSSRNG
jgi:hypothetical protein